ncbi:unnamed protein product [Schistocephalus solidus]|uniref:Uncharacterized protein n=1 Tax=Schistocephalus solidus TaxID=70667 RepID=A0A183T5M8_SCHSO|nr:unnamed protein product [Schistocephalus solidus]
MGLFGHMHIHDSRIHHSDDNTDTPCTASAFAIHSAPATPTTMNDIPPASTISPAHTAPAHSPHALAWSVTCESIVQRLVNQCLELQHTAEIAASTALTVLVHSLIAWAFSVTCAFTKTCGKPPEAKLHMNTLSSPIH